MVIHNIFQYKTLGMTFFSQRKRAVPSQSVVSFQRKLHLLKIYVNSEASWTNFLIENG